MLGTINQDNHELVKKQEKIEHLQRQLKEANSSNESIKKEKDNLKKEIDK